MAEYYVSRKVSPTDPIRRASDLYSPSGLGFLTCSAPGMSPATASPTTQVVLGAAVYLYAGELVTNIHVCVQTAGVGTDPTAAAVGLWSSDDSPVCLAIGPDLVAGGKLKAQGWQTMALSSPYAVSVSGVYYPSFWINGAYASTNVAFVTHGSSGQISSTLAGWKRSFAALKSAVSVAPAVNNTGTYALTAVAPIFAIS